MGRSSGARKKARIKPWHSVYARLNLPQLFNNVIPKRIRAIDSAKARLKTARTVKAAAVEWQLIETNLTAIDGVYSKIRKALRDGGDMHRWNEFPGLEVAVKQVNDISWADLRGRGIPGGAFKFDIPKFDDSPSTSNDKVIKSDDVATGANGEPVQKHIKDEVKEELEEGEIKDEIKEENADELGVALDIGPSERHQDGYPYQPGFGDFPPGSLLQSMPQSSDTHPGHPRAYRHGLLHQYSQPLFTPFFAVIPYYSIEFPSPRPDDLIRGGGGPQSPYAASDPQLHALPPRVGGSTPSRIRSPTFIPSPSLARPGRVNPSSNLTREPSPAKTPPSTSPLEPAAANQPEGQRRDKRKLSTVTDASTSAPRRPLKRRLPVASDFMSDDDEPQRSRSKRTLPVGGHSDFGTWFQEQVAGSKKKLSHLEHVSAPMGNKKLLGAQICVLSVDVR